MRERERERERSMNAVLVELNLTKVPYKDLFSSMQALELFRQPCLLSIGHHLKYSQMIYQQTLNVIGLLYQNYYRLSWVRASTYVHMYTGVYLYICVCVCVWVFVCLCVCVCVCVCVSKGTMF